MRPITCEMRPHALPSACICTVPGQVRGVRPPPPSLSLPTLAHLPRQSSLLCGFDFVAAPLVHPRYRRQPTTLSPDGALAPPFTRTDVLLTAAQWSGQVGGGWAGFRAVHCVQACMCETRGVPRWAEFQYARVVRAWHDGHPGGRDGGADWRACEYACTCAPGFMDTHARAPSLPFPIGGGQSEPLDRPRLPLTPLPKGL